MSKQHTISGSVSLSGRGLHTGKQVTVTFHPAPLYHGVLFRRIDLPGGFRTKQKAPPGIPRKRLSYAVYRGGHLLGTCNFSRESDTVWERGILAALDAQGKGETALWERQLIGTLPVQVKALSAKVKADNIRSVRYHEKMGYAEQSRDAEYIYYLLQL